MATVRSETPHGVAALDSKESSEPKPTSDVEATREIEAAAQQPPSNAAKQDEPQSSKATTALVLVSVLLSMFLVGLDRTIISTVRTLPRFYPIFLSSSHSMWLLTWVFARL